MPLPCVPDEDGHCCTTSNSNVFGEGYPDTNYCYQVDDKTVETTESIVDSDVWDNIVYVNDDSEEVACGFERVSVTTATYGTGFSGARYTSTQKDFNIKVRVVLNGHNNKTVVTVRTTDADGENRRVGRTAFDKNMTSDVTVGDKAYGYVSSEQDVFTNCALLSNEAGNSTTCGHSSEQDAYVYCNGTSVFVDGVELPCIGGVAKLPERAALSVSGQTSDCVGELVCSGDQMLVKNASDCLNGTYCAEGPLFVNGEETQCVNDEAKLAEPVNVLSEPGTCTEGVMHYVNVLRQEFERSSDPAVDYVRFMVRVAWCFNGRVSEASRFWVTLPKVKEVGDRVVFKGAVQQVLFKRARGALFPPLDQYANATEAAELACQVPEMVEAFAAFETGPLLGISSIPFLKPSEVI